MCNISGYCGEGPPNPLRLKLLLAMGTERGEDSIGIVANNEIHKEVKTYAYGANSPGYNKAEGIHFIKNYNYPEFKNNNVVLQHNRKKSSGTVTIDAAHPYKIPYISTKKGEQNFYLIHNGTLTNEVELAEKYNVDIKDYETDSHLLAYLICMFGFEPLSFYDGGAALAFYWDENPNELFLYKGAKQITRWDNIKQENITYMEEERPLNYTYIDDGVYFSSLIEQLDAISENKDTDEKKYTVKDNFLYKFVGKKLELSQKIERTPLVVKKKHTVGGVTVYNSNNYGYNNTVDEIAPGDIYKTNRAMICWHEGSYQIIKKKKPKMNANGVFVLDSNGIILGQNNTQPDSTTYYFIDGDMIKDEETYYNCINAKRPAWSSDTHPDACHITAAERYQYGQYLIVDKLYKPLLSHYYLRINNLSYYADSLYIENAIKHVRMSKEMIQVEAFNKLHKTNFIKKADCSAFYFKKNPSVKQLNWDEIKVKDILGDLGSNDCYFPTKVNNNQSALFIQKDSELEQFNSVYGTEFITRKAANQWHFDTYLRPYEESWPDPIYTDDYSDLPFDVNEDKTEELNKDSEYSLEIEQQLLEEYQILIDGVDDFLEEYQIFTDDLPENAKRKILKLQKLKKVL